MNKELGQSGSPARTDLTVDTLAKVDDTGPDGEPPALVPKTMLRGVEGEHSDVVGIGGVADEAPGGVTVEPDHEEEREVVGIPESLKALVTNLVMGSGVHQEHDEQHEVTRDATGLRVMDIQCKFGSHLCNERQNKKGVVGSITYECAQR